MELYFYDLKEITSKIIKTVILYFIFALLYRLTLSEVFSMFIDNSELVSLIDSIISYGILIFLVFRLAKDFELCKDDFIEKEKFTVKDAFAWLGMPILLLTVFMLILIILTCSILYIIQFFGLYSIEQFLSDAEDVQPVISQTYNWSFLLRAIIIAPIAEELAFRGIMLKKLSKYDPQIAFFLTCMIFAVIHGSLFNIPIIFCSAFLYAGLSMKHGSIIPSILLHSFDNFFLFLFKTALNHEYTSIFFVFMLLVSIWQIYLIKKGYFKKYKLLSYIPTKWEKWKFLLRPSYLLFYIIVLLLL